jgi:hypothetical protein
MTSTVTAATIAALSSTSYELLSTTVGIVVVIVLVVLLLQKELARVLLGERARAWLVTFDLALVPLLVAFVVIITARLAELLR